MKEQLKQDSLEAPNALERSGEYALKFVKKIEDELFKRGGLKIQNLDAEMKKLISLLPEVWNGSDAEKSLIREAVSKSQILSLGQVLTALWNSEEENRFKKFYTSTFVSKCNKDPGSAVFTYNAFKVENYNIFTKDGIVPGLGKELLVYCPGVILSSLQNSKNPEQVIDSLSFVIGHELTHVVDTSKQPALYTKWMTCVNNTYTFPAGELTLSHKELSSDIGGINLLMERFKNLPPEETYKNLRRVLAPWLCPNQAATSFGKKRLGLITGNPKVIKALGCQSVTKPFCNGIR